MIANHAAGIVVAKFGTATASAAELLEALSRDEALAVSTEAAVQSAKRPSRK